MTDTTSDSTVNWIAVADNPDAGEFYEITKHRDKRLVVIQEAILHVWYDGTYYRGTGTADRVQIGDTFCYPTGISGDGSPQIKTVADIEHREGKDDQVVFESGDEVAVGFILGDPKQMGQLYPPELLKQHHEF